MKRSTAVLLSFLMLFSGCGTLVHGTNQNISFNSEPEKAKVRLSNGYEATTPETVSLSRGASQVVTFEKPGYQKKQVIMDRHFNWGASIFGNILWLLPGLVVDFISGGAWTLNQENINVTLDKE